MRRQLTCPACKEAVQNVKLDDGQVLCPHCDHLMFVYRAPGEDFTPAEFTNLLHTRGNAAAEVAKLWFPRSDGKITRMSIIEAGIFIFWLWPKLALIFKKDEVDGS